MAAFSLESLYPNQNIVVTSTREKPKVSKTSSSAVNVFDRFDIEESGVSDLKSFLSQVTELNLFSAGAGQVTSVQMRGNDNRHTLIIVDGIPLSDVTSPDGASRFESLGLFDIERIEILYGAQSVLYGSQAIGGVIKITTQSQGDGGRAQIGGGNYGRSSGHGLYRGSYKDFRYKIFLGVDQIEGPSSRVVSSEFVNDDDRTTRLDGNLFLSYKGLSYNHRFQKLDYEYDAIVSDELDDEGTYENSNQSLRYENSFIDAFVLRSTFKRVLESTNNNTRSRFIYNGETIRTRVSSSLDVDKLNVNAGVEARLDKTSELDSVLDDEKTRSVGDVFVNGKINISKSAQGELGARVTKNEGDGSILTYRASGLINLADNVRLKASYSTGVKIPELYHIYTQFGANPDLRAERAESADITFEYEYGETVSSRLSLFGSRYDNYIDYDLSNFRYENIEKAEIYGFSYVYDQELSQSLSVSVSYTFLKTENELNNRYLRLRPMNAYRLRLDYKAFDTIDLFLVHQYKGERDDTALVLPSYRLFNVGVMWQQSDSVFLNFELNNLTNVDYEEVAGFTTRGLNGVGRVEVVF